MEDNPNSLPTIGLLGQAMKIAVYILIGLVVISLIGSLMNTVGQWIKTFLPEQKSTPVITTFPTPFSNIIITPTQLLTLTPSQTSTPITFPTPYPTPVIGVVGPPFVGTWHDNYIVCDPLDRYWVDIHGVEIKGSTLPYEFIFFQSEVVLREITSNDDYVIEVTPNTNYFIFAEPIRVNKGSYVHVVIKFIGEEELWQDDLFYRLKSEDPSCYDS